MLPNLRPYYEDCIANGIRLYWRTLGRAGGMEVHPGEIEYTCLKNRQGIERIYNLRVPPGGLDRVLDELVAGVQAGDLPDSFVIPPGQKPDNLAQLLVLRGFAIDTSGVCMALDLDGWPAAGPQAGEVRVTPVRDPEGLRQWADIVNVALAGSTILSYEQFADLYCLESTRFFLAWFGQIPASACMTLSQGETVTLEMVATLRVYRRRGLATAAVTAALRDLQLRGVQAVTLRADPDGMSLYKKIGFVEVCSRMVTSYRWNR